MMTANKRPVAIVYHYDDADWNDDTGWISAFYTEDELQKFLDACGEEQPYTGKVCYVYRLK